MRTSERTPSLVARLGLPLILLLCIIQSWRPLGGGFDFWAHAAVGRWIANHGAIPKHGLFLWSAMDFPWVYYSWLCQWFLFKLFTLVGAVGIMVFTTALVCATFALLWRLWRKRAAGRMPAAAPLLVFIAVLVSTPRFQPRQELLTALFLVIFLSWLTDWNERRADETRSGFRAPLLEKSSWLIAALVVLWVNIHPLVVFALGLLVLAAFADAVQYRFDRRARGLFIVVALCCAAMLCNPWGTGYWASTGQLRAGGQATYIQEWMPIWVDWPAMQPLVIGEGILVFAALAAWLLNPSRRWAELLWVLASAALFLRSRRLLWMLAIVCVVVMASNTRAFDSDALWRKWRRLTSQSPDEPLPPGFRFIGHGGLLTILVLTLVSLGQVFPQNRREFWPVRGVSRLAPVRAADYVLQRGVPPRIFADYEYASYLHWRLNGPDRKGVVPAGGLHPLYIDLFNAYPDAAMAHYFQILKATPAGLARFDALGINTVILGRPHWHRDKDAAQTGPGGRKLDRLPAYLDHNPAWKRAFGDESARIWVRRIPRRPAANGSGTY